MAELTDLAVFHGDDSHGDAFSYTEIKKWALEYLPEVSASPFATWLDQVWDDYDDDSGTQTNGAILQGALSFWTGRS
jgi:hypothetical protein